MALYEILEDGTIRKIAGGLKDYTAGDGISINNGVISQTVISKAVTNSAPSIGTSYTGTSRTTILTLTMTTKGGRIFSHAYVQAYVNANIGYLGIMVDDVVYGEVCTNSNSKIGLALSICTGHLSAGVHTIKLTVRCQNASNIFYLPTYNTGKMVAMEV